MTRMLLGLLIVLSVHSLRLVAEDWRNRAVARLGRPLWLTLFSLVSMVGLVLLVWGFAQAREQPLVLWQPLPALRHAALALTALSFILLLAALVPANHLKARLRHPLLLALKTWALAHLLLNGMLVHAILFGSLLLWAVLAYRAARQRDRLSGAAAPPARAPMTLLTLVLGLLAWWLFASKLHGWLIGIKPVPWW